MEIKETEDSRKKITKSRLERARKLIDTLRENAFSPEERSDLWKLSQAVGGRTEDELLLLDGLCCLLHLAVSEKQNMVSLLQAAELHVERETGSKIRILDQIRRDAETSKKHSGTAGDRLVIHCLDTRRLWSETHGWVSNPIEATTYDPEQVRNIEMPSGRCQAAEVRHVRDLFSIDGWLIP
jgi:hypothetical protein